MYIYSFVTFFVKIVTNHLISLFTCELGTNNHKKSSIQIYRQKISLKSVGSMKGKYDTYCINRSDD